MSADPETTLKGSSDLLSLLRDPKSGWLAQAILVTGLSALALLLRCQLDLDGVRDVDALNFGLAAWDFNPVEQRPHPPGYPGYVLFLKAIHLLAPTLEPASVAKWGSRILGTLCVPAAWWSCRLLLQGAPSPTPSKAQVVRPLLAASLVVCQPLLWYYGADGQSHAGEALATLVLLGWAVHARRKHTAGQAILLAFAFGLAGSLRPTIAALNAPLLLWVFWGTPVRTWCGGAVAGGLATLSWYIPTVLYSGGLSAYQRATEALFTTLFLQNFSAFGATNNSDFLLVNLNIAAWGLSLAALLFAGWDWKTPADGDVRWRRAVLVVVVSQTAFYFLVYTAEAGYFCGLAALSVLAPATWVTHQTARRGHAAITSAAALLGALFVLGGPAKSSIYGTTGEASVSLPTLSSMVHWNRVTQLHREALCPSSDAPHSVIITDSGYSELQRQLALSCNVSVVRWLAPNELQPNADGALIYRNEGLRALPSGIPFELGPPASFAFQEPSTQIVLSPLASPALRDLLLSQQACPSIPGEADSAPAWTPSCLPELKLGSQRLIF